MAQSTGTMLGPYRIDRLIGAGGMGEVYAASDTRLGRTVAIKVLPSELAADSDRLQRFEREARAVSSLNHPHIATLFDVGEQAGTHYLVMELVEGRTLADQLARGKLRVSVALDYAAQIAEALDSAHRKGIIHRDLKPGNVMITSTGVKLLDFGLAKLAEDERAGRGAQATTQAREPITAEGAVLGTAQYMAPEQLEGEEVDARADIFSFGCVLYEMLSGKPPFEGNSAAGLTAAILRAEPSPLSTQAEVPAVLDHLVATCLAKNRNDRWQTAHDVSKQLEWIRSSLGSLSGVSAPAAKPRGRKPVWIAAAVGAAIVAAAVFLFTQTPRSSAPAQLMRFTVSFRDQVRYSIGEDFFRSASISPDGERIVFTGADQATGTASLYIRPIGSEQVTAIRGSEDGTEPFWSPDSKSVGFYARGKVKIANLDEGTTRDLAEAASTGGATWNEAGQILISLGNPGPIMLVPAAGGTPKPATTLESGDNDHDWPQFLADGTHFLYAVRGSTAFSNSVYLTQLGSSSRTLLVEDVWAFAYAAPNHLLYIPRSGGTLIARTLDVSKSQLTGPPVTLAENALAPFSASRTGALTYRTVPSAPNPLVWIRPDGTVIGEALPPGYYTDPVISPDGTQVALATKDDANARYAVSILDLATGNLRKLTASTAGSRAPVWSPDGKSIVFLSYRPEAPGLYRKDASGVGAEELILKSKGVLWPYQWTRDHLLYFEGVSGSNDIWMMATNDFNHRTPLIQTPYNDVDGAVSPDDKWLAYVSNETGRWEIYLTTFPPSATKIVVTTTGGCDPTWSPDGSTLYYPRPSSAELLSMSVTSGDPPRFGSPRRIYAGPLDYPSDHSIDVDPKGDRVVVAPSYAVLGDLTVLVNWESMLSK